MPKNSLMHLEAAMGSYISHNSSDGNAKPVDMNAVGIHEQAKGRIPYTISPSNKTYLLRVINSIEKLNVDNIIVYNKELPYPLILKVVTNESQIKTTDPVHLGYIDIDIKSIMESEDDPLPLREPSIISRKIMEVLYVLKHDGHEGLLHLEHEMTKYNAYTDLITIVDNEQFEFDNAYSFADSFFINRPKFNEIYYADGEECKSDSTYIINVANGEYNYNEATGLFHRKMYKGNSNLNCIIDLFDIDEEQYVCSSNSYYYDNLIKLISTGYICQYNILKTSSNEYKQMFVSRKSLKAKMPSPNLRDTSDNVIDQYARIHRSPLATLSQNPNRSSYNPISPTMKSMNRHFNADLENMEFSDDRDIFDGEHTSNFNGKDRRGCLEASSTDGETINIQVVKLYYSKSYGRTNRPSPLYAVTSGYDLRVAQYKEQYWPVTAKVPALPSHDSIHRLDAITTLDLIDGRYNYLYSHVIVVDCRFSYEYRGGHIDGAINFSKETEMVDLYYSLILAGYPSDIAIVFHCEFSSYRAPQCAMAFRSQDRKRNFAIYPELDYPNVFVAVGGYKALHGHDPIRCRPREYLPMADKRYRAELSIELSEHDLPAHLFSTIYSDECGEVKQEETPKLEKSSSEGLKNTEIPKVSTPMNNSRDLISTPVTAPMPDLTGLGPYHLRSPYSAKADGILTPKRMETLGQSLQYYRRQAEDLQDVNDESTCDETPSVDEDSEDDIFGTKGPADDYFRAPVPLYDEPRVSTPIYTPRSSVGVYESPDSTPIDYKRHIRNYVDERPGSPLGQPNCGRYISPI